MDFFFEEWISVDNCLYVLFESEWPQVIGYLEEMVLTKDDPLGINRSHS